MLVSKKLFKIISECSLFLSFPFSFHFLYIQISFLALSSFRAQLNDINSNTVGGCETFPAFQNGASNMIENSGRGE